MLIYWHWDSGNIPTKREKFQEDTTTLTEMLNTENQKRPNRNETQNNEDLTLQKKCSH